MNGMEIIHIDSSDDEEDDAPTKTAPAKGGGCIASSRLDPTPTPSKQLANGLSGMDAEDERCSSPSKNNMAKTQGCVGGQSEEHHNDNAAAAPRNNDKTQTQFTCTTQQSDDDDSSVSSSDSILEESLSSKPKAKANPSAKSKGEPALGKRAPIALDGTSEDELEIAGIDDDDEDCKMGGVDDDATNSHAQKKRKVDKSMDEFMTVTAEPLPPEVPLPVGATWRCALLMDHREFGCKPNSNFLPEVKRAIDRHFGGRHDAADICALDSADYLFVARLISDTTGEIIDERVLDTVIERKNIEDLSQCLILDSKKYIPLSFHDAQMYKFQHCGIPNKIFLMEGDENKNCSFAGSNSQMEKIRRLKRIKTARLKLERGEWEGVDLVCTRNRMDSIRFLIHKLEELQRAFNPRRPPTKTLQGLKGHINEQMNDPTFREYLRLRKMPGIGHVKAMKAIMDPKNSDFYKDWPSTPDWDKNFVCPEGKSKQSKSTLDDKATFWPAIAARSPTPDNTHVYRRLASKVQEKQDAVKKFDESVEGKERTTLNNKLIRSNSEMGAQDTDELARLDSERASLTLARDKAKRQKNEDDTAEAVKEVRKKKYELAVKSIADWDKSEDGKKRKNLMTKNRNSQVEMTKDELARLDELNKKRTTFSWKNQTNAEKSVSDCRKAVKAFDESAEGKERKKLDEKSKSSKTKMTVQDTNDLAELDTLRASLVHMRDVAKREKHDDRLAAAKKALKEWDASKNGRKRGNLMVKRNASRKEMTAEESARLAELNKKRNKLATAQPLLPDIQTMKIKDMKEELATYGVSTIAMIEKNEVVNSLIEARKLRHNNTTVSSTAVADLYSDNPASAFGGGGVSTALGRGASASTAFAGTGYRLGSGDEHKKSNAVTGMRKEPPEQLAAKRQKLADARERSKEHSSNGTETKDKKAASSAASSSDDDDNVLCGLCFSAIDIWVEKNIVTCNQVAACGATFHQSCLAPVYDITMADGCVTCKPKSTFFTSDSRTNRQVEKSQPTAKKNDDVVVLESDDDDVIVID